MELLDKMYRNFIKIDGFENIDDNLEGFEEDDEETQYLIEHICESDYIMSDVIPLSYDGDLHMSSVWRYVDKNVSFLS